ncbi:hypothetical protein [Thalassobacillus sp. CUG 92003]|uniref:hypothetical protein n=1 Tax=Thalassobacillus sp. CUG 92003 TaxID=2736641 RepID=UPI0015E62F3C|nr:hypothetical protein [Thalassobacillus sp. CUG 92003]
MDNERDIKSLKNIRLDGHSTSFHHAFIERLEYEWMIEIVTPSPIPRLEEENLIITISFQQNDGIEYQDVDVESYEAEEGRESIIYRFFMYPDD